MSCGFLFYGGFVLFTPPPPQWTSLETQGSDWHGHQEVVSKPDKRGFIAFQRGGGEGGGCESSNSNKADSPTHVNTLVACGVSAVPASHACVCLQAAAVLIYKICC